MTSAVLELQGAIVALLKADAGVTAIVGARVFDHVPRSATGQVTASFPFVGIAGWSDESGNVDCIDALDVTVDIDCWSRDVGFPEAHRLAAAVRAALDDADLTLADNAAVYFRHRSTRTLRDPDGLTSHAVLTFEAALEQN